MAYRTQITEVYERPGVMTGVQYPTGQKAYENKVIYEDKDVYRHHRNHNPERVVTTEVERVVEKPNHGYGAVVYEDVQAAQFAQTRPYAGLYRY